MSDEHQCSIGNLAIEAGILAATKPLILLAFFEELM